MQLRSLKQAPRSAQETGAHEDDTNQRVLSESEFVRAICLERKRTERSTNPFLLMLAGLRRDSENGTQFVKIQDLIAVAVRLKRETDIIGWYCTNDVLGVVFTELGKTQKEAVLDAIRHKVTAAIHEKLSAPDAKKISLSFHFFPDDSGPNGESLDSSVYPEVLHKSGPKKLARLIKRAMDLAIASLALVMLSPLLLVISLLVKLTSRGPVLFRQVRVGHHGTTFVFLKFRSMYLNSKADIHKDYVTGFISGRAEAREAGDAEEIYKITNDPRVTPLGRFLRRTSIDELPQLVNVLKGEMSLVGPRPPLPYEFECYDTWHRRRVIEAKPGITGLWQVCGRSRTSFDGMVRMDLQYAKHWSLWLDLKILLKTPGAVLSGDGAY